MRMLGPNLATCQLSAWTKNGVKFEFSNENQRENQTKTRWDWNGRHNKNECGKYESICFSNCLFLETRGGEVIESLW